MLLYVDKLIIFPNFIYLDLCILLYKARYSKLHGAEPGVMVLGLNPSTVDTEVQLYLCEFQDDQGYTEKPSLKRREGGRRKTELLSSHCAVSSYNEDYWYLKLRAHAFYFSHTFGVLS